MTVSSLTASTCWPAISEGKPAPRQDLVFFASETPIRGSFMFTAFNDHWKLVQEVQQGLLSASVTNYLFKISEDPHEYNNLAAEHPAVVARMAEQFTNGAPCTRWPAPARNWFHPPAGAPP